MAIDDFQKQLVWLGHDGFRIDAAKTVYIDPYQTESTVPADLILITHEHFDHCSAEDVAKISKQDTIIVTEKDSAAKLSGDVRILKPGDRLSVLGLDIEAVPAYNTDKDFHPKEKGWLGFIVSIGGVRLYHSGDTDFIPEMASFEADIALLPVSGTYVMTAEQAVQAAMAVGAAVVVPMHYGAIVGDRSDAEAFKTALEKQMTVVIPQKDKPLN